MTGAVMQSYWNYYWQRSETLLTAFFNAPVVLTGMNLGYWGPTLEKVGSDFPFVALSGFSGNPIQMGFYSNLAAPVYYKGWYYLKFQGLDSSQRSFSVEALIFCDYGDFPFAIPQAATESDRSRSMRAMSRSAI